MTYMKLGILLTPRDNRFLHHIQSGSSFSSTEKKSKLMLIQLHKEICERNTSVLQEKTLFQERIQPNFRFLMCLANPYHNIIGLQHQIICRPLGISTDDIPGPIDDGLGIERSSIPIRVSGDNIYSLTPIRFSHTISISTNDVSTRGGVVDAMSGDNTHPFAAIGSNHTMAMRVSSSYQLSAGKRWPSTLTFPEVARVYLIDVSRQSKWLLGLTWDHLSIRF